MTRFNHDDFERLLERLLPLFGQVNESLAWERQRSEAMKHEIAKLQAVVWVLTEMVAAQSGVTPEALRARIDETLLAMAPAAPRPPERTGPAAGTAHPYRGGRDAPPPTKLERCPGCGAEVPASSLKLHGADQWLCEACSFRERL